MTTKKPKFNILDGFIIVLILLIIAAAVYIFLPKLKNSGEKEVIARYEIVLSGCEPIVAEEFVKAYESDEILKVGEKDLLDAKIVSVKVENAKSLLTDNTNKVITETSNDSYRDITLVLETTAIETDREILFGETPIRVGTYIAVKSKKVSGYDYITDLNTREGR